MSERVCENQRCGKTLKPKRPHQRFCTSACRFEAWAEERENGSQVPAQRVVETVRRASRDGLGVKVYLTAPDLQKLAFGEFWDDKHLVAKLARAAERLARKTGE